MVGSETVPVSGAPFKIHRRIASSSFLLRRAHGHGTARDLHAAWLRGGEQLEIQKTVDRGAGLNARQLAVRGARIDQVLPRHIRAQIEPAYLGLAVTRRRGTAALLEDDLLNRLERAVEGHTTRRASVGAGLAAGIARA